MIALDIGIVSVAILAALVAFGVGYQGLAPVMKLRRRKSVRVSDVVRGPVEIAGKIRAVGDPIEALDGRPLAAALWNVSYSYRSGSKSYSANLGEPILRAAAVEIVDATGSCPIDLGCVVPMGPERSYAMEPAAFAARHPDVWERITQPKKEETLKEVRIAETVVRHDVEGLVSGEAIPDDSLVPSADYRGAKQRMRIIGTDVEPLLLSGWSEPVTRSYLLRPSLLLFAIGGILLGAAALFWVARTGIYGL